MTLFFVDAAGNYIGGFDGAEPPEGAIEIPEPPAHGLDKLVNGEWVEYVQPLSVRLIELLNANASTLATEIQASGQLPPPGTFSKIGQISTILQEVARLVPEAMYAVEAMAAITSLGVLPAPLESVRLEMLSLITAELGQGAS